MPNIPPKPVATPFPPRNFRKTGKRCPSTTERTAVKAHRFGRTPRLAIHPTSQPFPKSPANVRIPTFLPHTRRTFVKPIFRLPACCGSGAPNKREKTSPNGIEPSRKAPRQKIGPIISGDMAGADAMRATLFWKIRSRLRKCIVRLISGKRSEPPEESGFRQNADSGWTWQPFLPGSR